jgi:class 3 adenylate cyclase
MSERERLEKAISDLETQRASLGDESVDTALKALREKLSVLERTRALTPELTGERKVVTIMFVDISGFTALAESMDPETVRNLVNACFDRLVPVIERYGGTVTKFIGDCIESVFGAPLAHENDPERALRCALDIMNAIDEFNADRGIDLGLHLGINTGSVIAGGIGSSGRQDYAVTGDAINVAARLEDVSRRGEILVGPDTYRLTRSQFTFDTLPPVRVQGKSGPLPVYRLAGLKDRPERRRWLESAGLSSPLVGRETAFRSVTASIQQLRERQGGILFVTGEAGLGKSRLMAEVRKQTIARTSQPSLRSPGIRWLEGRALSFGESISYWPFQGILWQWAGITEEDNDSEAWDKLERHVWALFGEATAEVLPYLGSLLRLEVRSPYADRVKYLDGEAMGRQVYLTMRRFFERLARENRCCSFSRTCTGPTSHPRNCWRT